ncbi:MAG: hypothetical protein M9941_11765, partial [Anaerolineae bacterium]|nr:hypothetical protein [Anaerolineae bacterium]
SHQNHNHQNENLCFTHLSILRKKCSNQQYQLQPFEIVQAKPCAAGCGDRMFGRLSVRVTTYQRQD